MTGMETSRIEQIKTVIRVSSANSDNAIGTTAG